MNTILKEDRLKIVKELCVLGVESSIIARALKVSIATIHKDFQELGGFKSLENRITKKEEQFQEILRQFVLLSQPGVKDGDTRRQILFRVFSYTLKERTILEQLTGVQEAMRVLLAPQYPPDKKGYALLIGAIFNKTHLLDGYASIAKSAKDFWREYLTAIYLETVSLQETAPLPKSWAELVDNATSEYISLNREKIMPIWTEEVFSQTKALLTTTLNPREEKILRLRFGIMEQEKYTLEKTGDEFERCRERVRQIERKALEKLRKKVIAEPEEFAMLSECMEPTKELLQKNLLLRKAIKEEKVKSTTSIKELYDQFQQSKITTDVPLDTLLIPASALEVGIRAENCLKHSNIKFIGQLIQKKEHEMLKIQNLGRKSLDEIKAALGERGLSFGMSLSPEMQQKFDNELRTKDDKTDTGKTNLEEKINALGNDVRFRYP